ncbi:MAG: hypothetical protein LAT81_08765 [Oceanicaulis sp.]|nr:hypothetical protein [Oceanicaulis sp.]
MKAVVSSQHIRRSAAEVTRRNNAAFLTGPSDLLILMSALAHDDIGMADWVIVLMRNGANVPQKMLDVCQTMAPEADVCILDLQDAGLLAALLDRIGRHFRRVVISHLLGAGENAVLAALTWDELILSENGIATHVLPENRAKQLGPNGYPPSFPDSAILPLSTWPGMGPPSYLDAPQPPRMIPVDAEFYQTLHVRFQAAFRLTELAMRIEAAPSCAIVAGTSLHRTGIVSVSDETAAYQTCLDALAQHPAEPLVIWKPHPRLMIDNIAESSRLLVERRAIPIELLLPFSHQDCTMYSTASSSLLLASLWHGVAPWVIPLEMNTRRHPHVEKVRQLVSGSRLSE